MSIRIILNPNARQGDRIDEVRELLASWPEAQLVVTESGGHAAGLAEAAAQDGCATVVAAGGDGTLGEVLHGLDGHLDRVSVGLLPLGTGNDLARTLGISPDLHDAFEQLRAAEPTPIDVMRYRCGDRSGLFLNVAAGGFSGEVDERLTSELKQFWGPLAYLRAALETLPELSPYRLRLELDGEEETLDALNVVVANGRFVEVEGSVDSSSGSAVLVATKLKFEDVSGGDGSSDDNSGGSSGSDDNGGSSGSDDNGGSSGSDDNGGSSSSDDSNEFEFKGTISAVGGDTIQVGGRSVTITSGTQFRRITREQLVAGAFVEIKGELQADGSVLAERISLED